MKKAKKPPPPPEPIPPVRESGQEVAEKRKGQLLEERKRRGLQATLLSQSSQSDSLGG